MIFLSLQNVKPGMILGKPIYKENQPLLTEKTVLTPKYIKRLESIGVHGIYISNELMDDLEITDVISEKTRSHAFALAQKTLSQVDESSDLTPSMGRNIRSVVNNMIEDILNCGELILNLYNIKAFDDYIFNHSVNVCLYSLLTGIAWGFNQKQLEQLGIGAFLHDLGKMQISQEVLNKPGRLTKQEFTEIMKHPSFGYNILKSSRGIDYASAHIAYQHHEKVNGRGYPRNLQQGEIHEYARITAIADIFDAITSNRVYKKAMPNHEAVDIILASASHELDPDMVKLFLRHVPIYPLGTLVCLNDNSKGVVVRHNQDLPLRPVVRVLEVEGQKVAPYEVNLARVLELAIIQTES